MQSVRNLRKKFRDNEMSFSLKTGIFQYFFGSFSYKNGYGKVGCFSLMSTCSSLIPPILRILGLTHLRLQKMGKGDGTLYMSSTEARRQGPASRFYAEFSTSSTQCPLRLLARSSSSRNHRHSQSPARDPSLRCEGSYEHRCDTHIP